MTPFITEYFYSCFDLNKIKYFICFPTLVPTEFISDDSSSHYRVICTFLRNKSFVFKTRTLKYMYATVLNTEPERLLIADKIAYRTIGHFSIKFLHIELITI